LQQAGFDASAPSAWSAEGLLPFLPAVAQDLLFERVQSLSVAGSRIAWRRPFQQSWRPWTARWYFEDRTDVADWLRGHGWDVSATPSEELMARYGRSAPEGIEDGAPRSVFVSAPRSGS
jgi:methyltransferase (TIGR00027 family)